MNDAEMILLKQRVDLWRLRLHDISWFMRSLNEFIDLNSNWSKSQKNTLFT